MITENLEALLRKIAVCAKVNDEGGGNKAHRQVLAMFKAALDSPANPVEEPLVKVTDQGVQFGNAWYSHEKITGYSAQQLNSGDCHVTGCAYVKWLQSALAAK